MGSLNRRTFTPEYRREAAKLVIDTGRPIVEVAREIGVGPQLLGKWVAKERALAGPGVDWPLGEAERSELDRLRKENASLRMEVQFLGEVAAFFAAKTSSRKSSS